MPDYTYLSRGVDYNDVDPNYINYVKNEYDFKNSAMKKILDQLSNDISQNINNQILGRIIDCDSQEHYDETLIQDDEWL